MQPAVLIQFDQRWRGADRLRQQFAARRCQPSRNHTKIYRAPAQENFQQSPQRRFVFIHIVVTKEQVQRIALLLTPRKRRFQLIEWRIH